MRLFQPDLPVVWILLCAAIVLGIVCWFEIKRKQKHLVVRLFATLLAVVALLGLVLKPALPRHKTADYILLTQNYIPDTLDSLLQHYPASQLYRMPEVTPVKGTTLIKNYRDLNELQGNIHLLGDGVPPYMLDYIDTTAFHYYPSPLPEGFTQLAWRKKHTQHRVNTIEGAFYSIRKSFTLKLKGGATTEDSIKISGEGLHTFALKFTPKTSGRFNYELSATDSLDKIVYAENLPVEIQEQKPLSILVLSDYPTAEIRFLKNYLEAEKHQLTLRYAISKDKYRTEFINTDTKNSVLINSNSLAAYDLAIIDASALTSLSENQLRELKHATLTGLGTLLLLDSPVPPKAMNFLDTKATPVKSDTAALQLQSAVLKIPAVPVTLSASRKIMSVLTEQSGRIVAGYQHNGFGTLAFQLLLNTYGLQLAGEKERYAEIWSAIIEQTARQERQDHSLTINTSFPIYTDEPFSLEIISATEKPVVTLDSIPLPLMEHPLIPNIWHTKAWADNPGWHVVSVNNSMHSFFISDNGAWTALRLADQQQQLRKLSNSHLNSSPPHVVYYPMAPIIFYLIFLLSAGLLWLAPKL